MAKETSHPDHETRKETTHHRDGSSTDVDIRHGRVESIVDHDRNGNSHEHNVHHESYGGYSKGSQK